MILVIIWYLPTSVERQTATLLWLSRLSKYTLVDVFAVIGILVGVQLQLNVGGTGAIIRAEPRFGIIAFLLATVWEYLQIEVIQAMHARRVRDGGHPPEAGEGRLRFARLGVPASLLAASAALYAAGAATEIVYFASMDATGVCHQSYNLVTLGNALINQFMSTSNAAPGQTWILYLSYVVCILAFPVLTHLLQFGFLVAWSRGRSLTRLIEWTQAIGCFACVEVLLIGVFAVQYKVQCAPLLHGATSRYLLNGSPSPLLSLQFANLIMKVAGANGEFLDIQSELGAGFYVLIVYSVLAGFLPSCLRIRRDEQVPAKEATDRAVVKEATDRAVAVKDSEEPSWKARDRDLQAGLQEMFSGTCDPL